MTDRDRSLFGIYFFLFFCKYRTVYITRRERKIERERRDGKEHVENRAPCDRLNVRLEVVRK